MSTHADFKVKHGLVVNTTASFLSTVTSLSTTTGGVILSGGAGIAKDVVIGGTLNVGVISSQGNISLTSNSGSVIVTTATNATSTTTGALQVVGGAGFQGDIYARNIFSNGQQVGLQSNTTTNLAGGYQWAVPYQSGTGTTSFMPAPAITGTTYLQFSTSTGFTWTASVTGSGGGVVYTPYVDTLTGNGTTTTWALSATPAGKNYVDVVIDGVDQLQSAYNIVGNTIVFTEAPANSATIEVKTISILPYSLSIGSQGLIQFSNGGQLSSTTYMSYNSATNVVNISTTTNATSTTTGALVVSGGVGVGGNLYVGGVITATNVYVNGYAVSTASSLTIQSNGVSQGTAATINFSTGLGATVASNIATVTLTTSTLMANAVTAINLANGTAGQVPYQTAAGATSFYGPGSYGQFLMSTGTGAPEYQSTLTQSNGRIIIGTGPETPALSTTTGLLQILNGGIAVGKSIYVGTTATAASFRVNTGGLVANDLVIGSGSITKNGGSVTITGGNNGSPSIAGGSGIVAGNNGPLDLYSGFGGNINLRSATAYTTLVVSSSATFSTATGAFQVIGGVGIGGGLFVGGIATATTFVGSLTGTATTATNLAGGTAGQFAYQTGAGATSFMSTGSMYVGRAVIADSASGSSAQINTTAQPTNGTYYATFVDANNASATAETVYTTSSFMVNPGTRQVGIGYISTNSMLTVNGRIESMTDSGSEGGQITLRGKSFYRWSVDNFRDAFRIIREDDVTEANGIVAMAITSATVPEVLLGPSMPIFGERFSVQGGVYVSGSVTATTFVGNLTGAASSTVGTLTAGTGLTGTAFNGSANQTWTLNTSTLMANAVTANNLAGGTAGQFAYQTGAGATSFMSTGSMYVGNSTKVDTVSQNSNATYYPTFVDANNASGTSESVYTTSSFYVNASTGLVTANIFASTNNGAGTNFKVGDDAWLGDINQANTVAVIGQQNNANGYIVFGNSDTTALGRAGTGALTYGGNTIVHGGNTSTTYVGRAVLADSVTGSAGSLVNAVTFNNAGSGDASGTAYNGGTARTISYNTLGAMPTTGGTFSGPVTFSGAVTFSGTATYVLSTQTFYTDNILNLHVPPSGVNGQWTVDDGKDIGLRFHYYTNSTDTNAALVLANDTKWLEWYGSGAEGTSTFIGSSYGNFKTGGIWATQNIGAGYTSSQIGEKLGVNGGAYINGTVTATTFVGALSQSHSAGTGLTGSAYNGSAAVTWTLNTATLMATAVSAINLSAGSAMALPYQSASGTTAYLSAGTSGYVLQTNGTGSAPSWVAASGLSAGSVANALTIGTGLTGSPSSSFNGSTPVTISLNTATYMASAALATTASKVANAHSAGAGLTGSAFDGSSAQTWTLNTATLMATAVSAINLSAGSAMALPYQSASGTTAYLSAGTSGYILQTNGTGSAPTWVAASGLSAGSSTNADNLKTIQQTASGNYYPSFVDSNNSTAAYEAYYTTSSFYINPASGLTTIAAPAGGDGLPSFRVTQATAPSTFNWSASFMNSSLGASKNLIVNIGQAESNKNCGYIGFNHSGSASSVNNFLTFGLHSVDNVLNLTGNGYVGIGNTAPAFKLAVNTASDVWHAQFGTSGGKQFRIGGSTTAGSVIGAYNDDTNSSPATLLLQRDGGSVGIGVSSTAGKLHVAGAGNSTGGNIHLGDNTDAAAKWTYITAAHYNGATNATGVSLIGHYASSTANQINIGGNIYEAHPATEIQFYTHTATTHSTGGSLRLVITRNGGISFGGASSYGSSGQILQSNGDAPPTWVNASTIAAGSAPLTNTYVGYGSASNLLTGSSSLTWNGSNLYINGALSAYAPDNATINFSNADSDNATYTNRGSRVLTSNGTNWVADGKDPILTLTRNNSGTTRGQSIGLLLHNENGTTNAYSPLIGFSAVSNSGSYNSMYAAIMGKKTGYNTGVDTNWNKGELHFYTMGDAYVADTPTMTLNSTGLGIGTAPSVKFHVNGSSIVANNTSINPDSYTNQTIAGAITDGSWGVTAAIGGNAGTGKSWAIGHNGNYLYHAVGNHTSTGSLGSYMVVGGTTRHLWLTPTTGGNVGIGIAEGTAPGGKLEVSMSRTSSTSGIALYLTDNVTGGQTDGVYKSIRSGSNGGNSISEIRFVESDGSNNNTAIAFATQNTAGGLTERMRITQTGALAFAGAGNYGSSGQILQSNGNAAPTWVNASSITAGSASSVSWANVTNKPGRTDWNSKDSIGVVVGQLSWKNYGNSHTIFDASNATNPDGGACDRYTPAYPVDRISASNTWGYAPNLMGWNGSATYGVRVDYARRATIVADISDSAPSEIAGAGQLWWESDTGRLKIYYNDGSSSQWVDVVPVVDTSLFFSKAGGAISGPVSINGALDVTGNITATGEITAYYSDRRLKTDVLTIENALVKVKKLNGVTYRPNELAKNYGLGVDSDVVGLFADEVESVLPQAVKPAPFDIDENGNSKSGENYKTIQYEKVVPLLVEAIKEQQQIIEEQQAKIDRLMKHLGLE